MARAGDGHDVNMHVLMEQRNAQNDIQGSIVVQRNYLRKLLEGIGIVLLWPIPVDMLSAAMRPGRKMVGCQIALHFVRWEVNSTSHSSILACGMRGTCTSGTPESQTIRSRSSAYLLARIPGSQALQKLFRTFNLRLHPESRTLAQSKRPGTLEQ